ncbi:MAG: sigma-70 family RNA polymerase sigma factor [Planctomycetes bacterium]|nr:sigma-70 family RNA polymerase sigma factor [Planctomycetota bacterium]
MKLPTEDLIQSASRGDGIAVDQLLERYLPGLEAFIRLRQGKMLRAKESAADLVQSVCREVLEHIDRFQYRGEIQFKHWLYVTALRKIANRAEYYRAEKRDAAREVGSLRSAGSAGSVAPEQILECYGSVVTPSRAFEAREELARIESAFEELPEDYREVILLSKFVGLSHAEIATEMGRSDTAVRTLLSRALARLAGILEKREGGGSATTSKAK